MLNPPEITECILHHRLALMAYLFSVTRNYHMAEDVFQETCVKAIRHDEPFCSTEHALSWFRVVARHRAIDMIRASGSEYVGLSEQTLDALAKNWSEADESKSIDERRLRALAECMKTLTPLNRTVLQMKYFENRSASEISEFMGNKISSAYQAISRVHQTLGDCIAKRMRVQQQ